MTLEELYEWMTTAPAVGRMAVVIPKEGERIVVLAQTPTEQFLDAVYSIAEVNEATLIAIQLEAWAAKIYPGAPYIPSSQRGDKESVIVLHVMSRDDEIIAVAPIYGDDELGDFQRSPENVAGGRTERLREALRDG